MAAIVIRQPVGETPILNSQLLPDGYATVAQNTRLWHGDLRPLKMPSIVMVPTKPGVKQTIYRYGESLDNDTQFWWTFTTDVDIIRAPIDGDTSERTYFTGDGYPKKTDNAIALQGGTNYPMNAYRLGMPVPDTAVSTATVSGTPTDVKDPMINAAYIITYVSAWGEEGSPSNPIGVVSFKPGQTVTLGELPVAPTGNYNVTTKRLYRSNTGDSGTTYQHVTDIPLSQTTYADTKLPSQLGEVCPTFGWEAPPEDGFGMTLGANGNAIILSGKTVYPCIPFIMYAYPPEYQQTTESEIVGAGAFGQNFAILTKANPYVISGIDPASYSMERLNQNAACVSKRSIVELHGGVVYASRDGLWVIDHGGLRPLTNRLFSPDQWQEFHPESIHACEVDGRYHMFYDTGVERSQLILSFGSDPYVIRSNVWCSATYVDPLRESMYIAMGGNINKWDAGDPLIYLWRSKEYRSPWYVNMGYGKVEAEAYPVTFKLYCDDVLTHTQIVTSNQPFRLPPRKARSISVAIEGSQQVNVIAIAETGEEISQA